MLKIVVTLTLTVSISVLATIAFMNRRRKASGRPLKILLIRHAQSIGNIDANKYGEVADPQIPLTELGKEQANELGERLTAMIDKSARVAVYTSPYLRCRETAEIALRPLRNRNKLVYFVEDVRLREQEFSGGFQKSLPDFEERDRYSKFFFRYPGGESAADSYDRVSLFFESLYRDFEQYQLDDAVVLVFSHGLTCRVFVMRWLHWVFERFERTKNPKNCDILCLERRTDELGKSSYALTQDSINILFPDFHTLEEKEKSKIQTPNRSDNRANFSSVKVTQRKTAMVNLEQSSS